MIEVKEKVLLKEEQLCLFCGQPATRVHECKLLCEDHYLGLFRDMD